MLSSVCCVNWKSGNNPAKFAELLNSPLCSDDQNNGRISKDTGVAYSRVDQGVSINPFQAQGSPTLCLVAKSSTGQICAGGTHPVFRRI
ncbi:MAG: hypothetical protein ACI87E_004610 [Mariniblastus sp.]|jgi:hypothetical protein